MKIVIQISQWGVQVTVTQQKRRQLLQQPTLIVEPLHSEWPRLVKVAKMFFPRHLSIDAYDLYEIRQHYSHPDYEVQFSWNRN